MKIKSSVWKHVSELFWCSHPKLFVKIKKILFFKNTNFKNYEFFTDDLYHTNLLWKERLPLLSLTRVINRGKYCPTWNQFLLLYSHMLILWSQKLIDMVFYFVIKLSNRHRFFLFTFLNANIIIVQYIAWTKQKYMNCIQYTKYKYYITTKSIYKNKELT